MPDLAPLWQRFLLSPGFGGVMALLAAVIAYRAAMQKVWADREQARQEQTREERIAAYKTADAALSRAQRDVETLMRADDDALPVLDVEAWDLDDARADLDLYCPHDVSTAARYYADSLKRIARLDPYRTHSIRYRARNKGHWTALAAHDVVRYLFDLAWGMYVVASCLLWRSRYTRRKRLDLGYERPPAWRVRAARAVLRALWNAAYYVLLIWLLLQVAPDVAPWALDRLASARDASVDAWHNLTAR